MPEFDRLSPHAQRGLCIMPRIDVDQFISDASYAEDIRRHTSAGSVGGFCVFGGTAESVIHTTEELRRVRSGAALPKLLFSADCEFGLPMRLREDGTEFPDAMALSRADTTGEGDPAYMAAQCIGTEMGLLGLHWNFAPVADINSNPANPIINTRSFGESAGVVSREAAAYHRGLSSAGIIATAKHFPGHGDTSQDSHRDLPYLDQSLAEFDRRELRPFIDLIGGGIPSVMTAHVAAPNLAADLGAETEEERRLPATLSRYLTSTLLRARLGFGGVVVTDALEMSAITEHYGASDAARRAFDAGADLILLPTDIESAHDGLRSVEPSRIRVSAARLLKLGATVTGPMGSAEERMVAFREQEIRSRELGERLAAAAIEVSGVPSLADDIELVILTDERPLAQRKALGFADRLRQQHPNLRLMTFAESLAATFEKPFVLVTFHRARGYIGGIDLAGSANSALERLASSSREKLSGLVLIGSPYIDRLFPTASFVVKTFSEARSSIHAVLDLLLRSR